MIIKNVMIYTKEQVFKDGIICMKNGIFDKILMMQDFKSTPKEIEEYTSEVIDGKGCYAIPGLIDMHFHLWSKPL